MIDLIRKNKVKYICLLILLLLYCYLQSTVVDISKSDIQSLYRGVEPGGRLFVFLVFYYGYAVSSFLIFATAAGYVDEYGPLIAYRNKSRKILVNLLLLRTLKLLVVFECCKLLIYICLLYIKTGLFPAHIDAMMFYYIFSDFVSLYIFLAIQTTLEILINPQVALLVSHGGFLMITVLSNFLMMMNPKMWINSLIPLNHQMESRFVQLNYTVSINFILLLVSLITIGFVIYSVGTQRFNRKDFV